MRGYGVVRPEEVRAEVMRDIADCADSPNGYIVSTGCDIPVDAPKENVLAFMDAVREYGPTRLGEKKQNKTIPGE